MITRRIILTVTMGLTLVLLFAACVSVAPEPAEQPAAPAEAETSEIMVMEPFARASIPNGAVYMQLMNSGSSADALIGVATDVADAVELHRTSIDDNDMMTMQPVERIDLPAGGSATLEPGGHHVMLLGIQQDLVVGDKFDLMLNFEQSGTQIVVVEIKEGMVMNHDQMDHDKGEMSHEGQGGMDTRASDSKEMSHEGGKDHGGKDKDHNSHGQ